MRGAFALAIAALLALGCGVRVKIETDEGVRRSAWKEWSWLKRAPVARGDTELAAIDERVRSSFEREMGARAFRRVERDRPDFLVTYYVAVHHPIDPKAIAYAAGGPGSARAAVNDAGVYAQGMLIVDLLDASTGKLVWRGSGRGVIDPEQTTAERSERIDDAVAAVVSELAAR